MKESMDRNHDGWRMAMARVGDILKLRNEYAFKTTDSATDRIPLIRQSNLGGDLGVIPP